MTKTIFTQEIQVRDPETNATITLEVHKDVESGALFAVEAEFVDQVANTCRSPYNETTLILSPDLHRMP